jgi:S1-C subfamily serine protease
MNKYTHYHYLSGTLHLQITLCVGTLLLLFLASASAALLIPLFGNDNNMAVVKAAAQEEQQLPSLSNGYAKNGDNIINSSSLPSSSSSQRQQLLLSTPPPPPPPDIFDTVKASVVQITPVPLSQGQSAPLLGSGFVYDMEGHILTNDHVVRDAVSVVVTLLDGNQYNSTVIGKDAINDIAVLRVAENLTGPLKPVEFGNSSNVRVGDRVFAIGNPYGLTDTLTGGFVSQVGRLLPEVGNIFPLPNMIQTDAIINPGNSGGILVNVQGQVIGMNTATINSQLGGSTGLGFAIPSKTLLREVPDIIKKGTYPHPWLGVSARSLTSDLDEASGLKVNFKGVLVDSLVKNGPAGKAGIHGRTTDEFLQVHGGDIITALDHIPVNDTGDYISYIENHKSVGEKIIITVYRNGHALDLTAVLGQRPVSSPYIISS